MNLHVYGGISKVVINFVLTLDRCDPEFVVV